MELPSEPLLRRACAWAVMHERLAAIVLHGGHVQPASSTGRYVRGRTHPLRHFSSLLLADSSFPRMTDDYPSFGDSSLLGTNVYYPFAAR